MKGLIIWVAISLVYFCGFSYDYGRHWQYAVKDEEAVHAGIAWVPCFFLASIWPVYLPCSLSTEWQEKHP